VAVLRFRRRLVLTRIASGLGLQEGSALQRRVARDAYTHAALSLLWFLRLPLAVDDVERLVACDDAAVAALAAALQGDARTAVITSGHVGT
jgi:hypothetical protein